ncbi:MAG: hypothetical protein HZA14_03090 [Nitrospirae bacterium]|nr:hypothetical protein [Nitrospirota bacterium]
METYKNAYRKNEDEALWELHEIRHQLRKKFKSGDLKTINTNALKKFRSWKRVKEKV